MTTHEVRRGRRVRSFVWVLGFHSMISRHERRGFFVNFGTKASSD